MNEWINEWVLNELAFGWLEVCLGFFYSILNDKSRCCLTGGGMYPIKTSLPTATTTSFDHWGHKNISLSFTSESYNDSDEKHVGYVSILKGKSAFLFSKFCHLNFMFKGKSS